MKNLKEEILIISNQALSKFDYFNGLNIYENNQIFSFLIENTQEMIRSKAETDTNFKQIIPYLVFEFDKKYFLMQRRSTSSEQRLSNKFTLGIGGHLRKSDMKNNDFCDAAMREFHEEVNYNGQLDCKIIGILNDDSTDVGKVHIGIFILAKGNSDLIFIKSEMKNGKLLSLSQCIEKYDQMESWSQFIIDYLIKQTDNKIN